jgi:tetratricopeptide (TPR) repeat protein
MRFMTPCLILLSALAFTQTPPPAKPQQPEGLRQAQRLDLDGKYEEARKSIQQEIDAATTPRAKANAQRFMALSFAFERNCKKAVEFEEMVIGYWVTREKEEPQNAFYQQGEMANEAARICIDSGDLNTALRWYRKGSELGLKEPNITADRKALWAFRLAHAEARVAARKKRRADAVKHIASAEAALNQMTELKAQQQPYLSYLKGYAALYLGDYDQALAELSKANQSDVFIQCLLGDTYEKLNQPDQARAAYQKAFATQGHNPPAAYAKPYARKKLGL